MRPDVLFFILIIGFFFLIWVATGGPTRPISFAGPFITPITGEKQTQSGYGTSTLSRYIPIYSDSGGANSRDSSGGVDSSSAVPANFGTPSVYRGMVTMSEHVNGMTNNPKQEYIELNASADNAKQVDITGWKIESTVTGNNRAIPGGTLLVHQGSGNVTSDVLLNPGDQAYIITGTSPIGLSFKDNECMGYFGSTIFYPSTGGECPSATSEFNAHYPGNPLSDDSCYAFVQKVNSCSVPDIPYGLTNACDELLSTYLNYNGCAAAHESDSGFYGTAWYVYLDQNASLWKSARENLKLLDASGNTVDMITY